MTVSPTAIDESPLGELMIDSRDSETLADSDEVEARNSIELIIACVRIGKFGNEGVFDRITREVTPDRGKIFPLYWPEKMSENLRKRGLGDSTIRSLVPQQKVLGIIEAPARLHKYGVEWTLGSMRHIFHYFGVLESLIPVVVVDQTFAHTRIKDGSREGVFAYPDGPQKAMEWAASEGISAIPVEHKTFERDLRVGLDKVFQQKNIVTPWDSDKVNA